jgi:hypothetical protein
MSGVSVAPPALKRPAVLQGNGKLHKSLVLNDPSLGSLTDIILDPSPDIHLGIAGTGGAVFLDSSGTISSRVNFDSGVKSAQFVDVTGDSVWEYFAGGCPLLLVGLGMACYDPNL